MIEKRIEVCIGSDRAKFVRARLSLLLVEGGKVISERYHSINMEPGADTAAIRAANEANIGDPNGGVPGAPWPKIPDEAWADVEAHIAIIQKPEVVAAFKAAAAALEQDEVKRIAERG